MEKNRIEEEKLKFKGLINQIDRNGIEEVKTFLDSSGFYTSPASTKYHYAFSGGLMMHSMSVHRVFSKLIKAFKLNFASESIILCSLLHDLCKAGAYTENAGRFRWNRMHPSGHGKLSIELIEKCGMILNQEEIEIILYHMGPYYTSEFAATTTYMTGEYSVAQYLDVYNRNKLAKLFHYCDDMSSQFVEKE